jgi:mannosyl-oligosaccharide glucosidase
MKREFLRETLQPPQLQFVPHVGYVSLFPFMMGAIPPVCSICSICLFCHFQILFVALPKVVSVQESWVLEKQLNLISNTSILWTAYGLRSLSRTSYIWLLFIFLFCELLEYK